LKEREEMSECEECAKNHKAEITALSEQHDMWKSRNQKQAISLTEFKILCDRLKDDNAALQSSRIVEKDAVVLDKKQAKTLVINCRCNCKPTCTVCSVLNNIDRQLAAIGKEKKNER